MVSRPAFWPRPQFNISQASPGSLKRWLYIIAAAMAASGVPYAWTFLRATNGALAIRSDRLAGPGNGSIALTYAYNDRRSRQREKTWSTTDMIRRWQWHNGIRTVALITGTLVGGIAVGLKS